MSSNGTTAREPSDGALDSAPFRPRDSGLQPDPEALREPLLGAARFAIGFFMEFLRARALTGSRILLD